DLYFDNNFIAEMKKKYNLGILKLDEFGELQWIYQATSDDGCFGAEIQKFEKNIYCCGSFQDMLFSEKDSLISRGGRDIFLFKLNEGCDETSFFYDDFSEIDNLELIEEAYHIDSTIALTPSECWLGGAVWHQDKVPVKKGFTTEFSFRFSEGVDKYIPEDYPGADGICFIIQNHKRNALGSIGGSLGFKNIPNSFVVEYDTYKNTSDQADNFHDPNENHIAVFCNGSEPNSPDHASDAHIATNDTIFPLVPDGRIFYSKIEYEQDNYFKVYLDTTNAFELPPVIELSSIDISEMLELDCEEFAWVGFTSATGNAYEKHELLSWDLCAAPTNAVAVNAKITQGPDSICAYSTVSYQSNYENNINYEWIVERGMIMSGENKENVVVHWGTPGIGKIKLIHTSTITGCADTIEKDIIIMELPNPQIIGTGTACFGRDETYSVQQDSLINNQWYIEGGNILGNDNDENIVVQWDSLGTALIKLIQTNCVTLCVDSVEKQITVGKTPQAEILHCPNPVFEKQEQIYISNYLSDCTIEWLITEGEIITGQNTDTLLIKWGNRDKGEIKLIQTNNESSCSDTLILEIDIFAKPDIIITGNEDACIDKFYTYYADYYEDYEYKWTTSGGEIIGLDNKDSVNVIWSKEGLGVLSLKLQHKLYALMDSSKNNINIHTLPEITFNELPDICLNDGPLILKHAIPQGGSYYGIGVSTNMFYPKEAGEGEHEIIYTYTEEKYGCKNSSSQYITVLPAPEKPVITQSGRRLISSSVEGNQWFKGGDEIPGANNRYYTPDTSGYYTVQVTDTNGCKSDLSEPYYFDITPVDEINIKKQSLRIYPNPATNQLFIEYYVDTPGNVSLELYDILGNKVAVLENGYRFERIYTLQFNIDDFSSGLYYLVFKLNIKTTISKISVLK
ncbi:T9SS type A sorting domain-containing protein, partial [Bacteroidota bacterium]